MTWKTRKFREISEIFARFAILTKFLSIEFLQTWQLSKTSEVTTFGWVLWNFYVPIWRYDLKHNEISWNQRNFCQICNFNQVFVDRISSNLAIIKKHLKSQLLGEFCEISTCQSENMTWKTRKYREISEIFARFAILSKFLSIEFLQTWQLSKTSEDTTFGWVLWNFYVPIWRYDLKHNEISWNQRNFCHICNFNQVFVDRISSNLVTFKNIIRHYILVSFVKFLLANLKIWLGKQGNIVKSAKFLPDLQF